MKTYTVFIEEKLCRGTEIKANSIEEAEEKVIAMYHNSEIILDSSDMGTGAEIMTEEVGGESTDWHEF